MIQEIRRPDRRDAFDLSQYPGRGLKSGLIELDFDHYAPCVILEHDVYGNDRNSCCQPQHPFKYMRASRRMDMKQYQPLTRAFCGNFSNSFLHSHLHTSIDTEPPYFPGSPT